MTTAKQVFESAMSLIDSLSTTGAADTSDNEEYKNRVLAILNILRGELYPYSDTYDPEDEGRPIAGLIREMEKPIDLDDYICQTLMPYGLAAHLMLQEDPAAAQFFQARYEELLNRLSRGLPSVSEDIEDVYGPNGGLWPYNEFSRWD